MKRLLLFLVAMLIASVSFAQDIIVKKDGSTIQAKVVKVSKSEVEYKKYDNLNGPTYTISVQELQCINYENGTQDTFVSPNYDPNIVTNETVTQYSNDKNLLDIYNNLKAPKVKKVVTPEMKYKTGKRLKIAGFAVGGTLIVAGLASVIVGASMDRYEDESIYVYNNWITHYKYYNYDRDIWFYIGYGLIGGGAAIGVPLCLVGSSMQKKYGAQVNSVSALSYDIDLRNGANINLGIDVLSSNLSYEKTPGIGVRYNF